MDHYNLVPRCECHHCTQARLSQFEKALLQTERGELHAQNDEAYELHRIADLFEQFVRFITRPPIATKIIITQLGGDMSAGTIKGIPVGGTGTFGETDPGGFVDPTGAVRTWASDDSVNTTLTPSTDAKVSQVAVAVAATAPVGGSFNLSYVDKDSGGNILTQSGPVPVPFLPAAVVVGDDVINQLS